MGILFQSGCLPQIKVWEFWGFRWYACCGEMCCITSGDQERLLTLSLSPPLFWTMTLTTTSTWGTLRCVRLTVILQSIVHPPSSFFWGAHRLRLSFHIFHMHQRLAKCSLQAITIHRGCTIPSMQLLLKCVLGYIILFKIRETEEFSSDLLHLKA